MRVIKVMLLSFITNSLFIIALLLIDFGYYMAYTPIVILAFVLLKVYWTYGGRYFSKSAMSFAGTLSYSVAGYAGAVIQGRTVEPIHFVSFAIFIVGVMLIIKADSLLENDGSL